MGFDPQRPQRPLERQRPLEAVAACLVGGSLLGALDPASGGPWLALVAILWACWCLRRAPGGWRLSLAVLVLLAAGRAGQAQGRSGPRGGGSWTDQARGLDTVRPPAWLPERSSLDHEDGRLGGGAIPLRLAPGVAGPGDQLQLLELRPQHAAGAPGRPSRVLRWEPSEDEVLRLAAGRSSLLQPVWDRLLDLRHRGILRLQQLSEPRLAGLLPALVFGERSGLAHELGDLFTRTGTRHLLALSGMHVVLAAALFAWPLGALCGRAFAALPWGQRPKRGRRGRRACALTRTVIVLCFLPLGGGGPPVARAVLAASLAALAPVLGGGGVLRGAGRRVDGRSLWCAALIAELASDPLALRRPGVQLSYLATLGLLAGVPLARRKLYERWPQLGQLAPAGRSGLPRPLAPRLAFTRLLRGFSEALLASAIASLCTLPVVWWRFGEFAPIGVLATPLAAIPITLLLGLGALYACLPGYVPESWLELPLRLLLTGLEHFDRWPWTPKVLPSSPGIWLLLTLAMGLAWCSSRGPAPGRLVAFLGAGILALLRPTTSSPPGAELVLLDVGHGTAALWRSAESGVWLFDAGSRDRLGVARDGLLPVLRRWNPAAITVVASHLDRDHVGALDWVAQRWPLRAWYGALPHQVAEILPQGLPRLDLSSGRAHLAKEGAFEAWMLRGRPVPGNEGSRMLELHYGNQRLLLSGDAEAQGLEETLQRAGIQGSYDRLLLPHHGSWTPAIGPLLRRSAPQVAWASASGQAPAQAPLQALGIPLRSTCSEGALTWRSSNRNQPRYPR